MIVSNNKNKRIVIAVIDSGIDTKVLDLKHYVIKSTGFRVDIDGYIIEDNEMKISNEHGTAIALIIKHLCTNIELISINILNQSLATDGRILLYALEKALQLNPDIIHLSLGTTKWKYSFPLKKIVKQANNNNILIVSSAHNNGLRSYPAYLNGVIGVKALNYGIKNKLLFSKNFFYATYTPTDIPGIEQLANKNHEGTSMSAAFVTGYIASLKSQMYCKNNEVVKRYLIELANKKINLIC